MKKVFGILVCLLTGVFLISCGSDKTATISSDTAKVKMSSVKTDIDSILAEMGKGPYKQGEVIVKFKSGVVGELSLKTHKAISASVKKRNVSVPTLQLVKLPEGMSVENGIRYYMSDPNVAHAAPNYIRKPSSVPNDTSFFQQWAMNNTGGYAGGTADSDIDAPEAWNISPGSLEISRRAIVAVIDSGIDYNHPDLVGNIWTGEANCTNEIDDDGNGYVDDCRGWDFFGNNNQPMDDQGHGTHVAGIIGAVGNNNVGTSGVMWYTLLMPVKFIGYYDDPEECGGDTHYCGSVWDEIDAIDYAVEKGARIINASFGGNTYEPDEYEAIERANVAGVLFVAAAGNDGTNNDLTPMYPASYNLPNIISVAASDQDDKRANFSNFGPQSVDISAPGVYIFSTVPGGYDFKQGTSMAAPHVSGLAGLLWSYYTHFNQYQILWTMMRYSDPTPVVGWTYYGGRINAYKALSSLLTPGMLTVSETASPSSETQISVAWTDNATGEDGYKIERKTGAGSYILLYTLPPDTASYNDTYDLVPGTTYTYRVKAFNTLPAESFYSNAEPITVSGTPEPRHHGGGGGGCSIGAGKNIPTAMADLAVLLIPVIVIAIIRRQRR